MILLKSLITAILLVNGIFFVLAISSERPSVWFREDGAVENLTAILLICTFVYATRLLVSGRIVTKVLRRWLLVFAVVGLLGFLDELSYGERLFGFSFPIVQGVKLDAIHDLIEIAVRTVGDNMNVLIIVVLSMFAISTIVISMFARDRVFQFWKIMKVDRLLPLYFVIMCCGIVSIIVMLSDAHALPYLHLPSFAEETLELNISISVLGCCIFVNFLESKQTIEKPES